MCVCVLVCEIEREGGKACVCERDRECERVYVRERMRECVYEREYMRVR